MQVLRPTQIRAWTKVKKNLMGKLKWEILRQFETMFPNGIKLVNLSNTSLEPAGNADVGGHAAPGEKLPYKSETTILFLDFDDNTYQL